MQARNLLQSLILILFAYAPSTYAYSTYTETDFDQAYTVVYQSTIDALKSAMFKFIFGYGQWFWGDPIEGKHCVSLAYSNNMFGVGGIYKLPEGTQGFFIEPEKKSNPIVNWTARTITYEIDVPNSRIVYKTCPKNMPFAGLNILAWEVPTIEKARLDDLIHSMYQFVQVKYKGSRIYFKGLGELGYVHEIDSIGYSSGGTAVLHGDTVQTIIDLGIPIQ